MIDTRKETLLSFAEAAQQYDRNISTLHRWRLRGIRGVKLESILLGGERRTSQEALERFFERSTAAADGLEEPETRTASQRKRAIETAERELAKAGI
jgi:hypothetical protein